MKPNVFVKRSRIEAPAVTVFAWHARPGALERLSPPWDPPVVLHRTGGIEAGARVTLRMKAGPVPFRWEALHTDYEPDHRLFRDIQVSGPFASWVHTHRFEPDGDNACFLEDRVEYALPFKQLGNHALSRKLVQGRLEHIFTYRHWITRMDLAGHAARPVAPMRILISGASGLVASALIPFLTTAGHTVLRLVRGAVKHPGEVFWDPDGGRLNPNALDGVDAVIHLAGENIGEGAWTDAKKRRIVDSRVNGTGLIARTLAKMNNPPKVLINASAIGYYGDRGNQALTETDSCGADFISDVCTGWECAAAPAVEKGIRTAFMRIGVVLTPAGGALARLLPPFKAGLGTRIAAGDQYMSWVGMEDVIGAIYHVLTDSRIDGPVNVVSPEPVTNAELTRTLAGVLKRPAILVLPSALVKLAMGQMGREILLSSTRVVPEKLQQTGYTFRTPRLEETLMRVLGKI